MFIIFSPYHNKGSLIVVIIYYTNTNKAAKDIEPINGEVIISEALSDSMQKRISVINKGQQLFDNNCKSCYKVHVESPGPGLESILDRRDKEWIYRFVRDPKGMIASGDEYAIALYNGYGKTEMTAFPTLTDEEIASILEYTSRDEDRTITLS